jgi:ADP-heptose:LPS heptosyltransferase
MRTDLSRIAEWQNARNVLCVRLDAMGDVLMTTPALGALRESLPDRRVTLLTSPSGAEAAALVPWVDEVIVYEAPWLKATAPRSHPGPDFAMIDRLRLARFDAAAIFTVYSQNPLPTAMLCYLAGIPLRLAHCRENPYQLLTDWVADPEPERLVLVSAIGCRAADERMAVRIPGRARRRVGEWLEEQALDRGGPWVAIHPGSTALVAGRSGIALAASSVWAALTARFCARRLRRNSLSPRHVAEMAVTSAMIPPLSVFWRLYGALKFRVLFL